jgi:hypothetical protein
MTGDKRVGWAAGRPLVLAFLSDVASVAEFLILVLALIFLLPQPR